MTYRYRTMLVHLNDKRRAEAVLEPVVSLASRYQAHLIGMHVFPGVPAAPISVAGAETVDARHGIKATIRTSVAAHIGMGDEILSRAADAGADLLVMGAYGHSRMREMVHAWQPPVKGPAHEKQQTDAANRRLREQEEQQLRALIQQVAPARSLPLEITEDEPYSALRNRIGTFGADLLAMGTHARSRLSTAIPGKQSLGAEQTS